METIVIFLMCWAGASVGLAVLCGRMFLKMKR